jgi:chemotaxis family two-component system sensor kinase Cph1
MEPTVSHPISVQSPGLAAQACAREPIHIPGSIQPHGALVVLNEAQQAVRASANAHQWLAAGSRPGDLEAITQALHRSALKPLLSRWPARGETADQERVPFGDKLLHVALHHAEQGLILEFEEAGDGSPEHLHQLYGYVRHFASALGTTDSIADLSRSVAAHVRALTGFNRVLVYAFDPEWNGTVIAEDGDGVLPSYLDLRFPASDIPAQARELYRLNPLRLIPDANYRPVPIEPALDPATGQPLDLTFCALRSVSPVHVRYMHNMGTMASMSISILVDGKLWGLMSCHHHAPRVVPPANRAACLLLTEMLSMQIGARERGAYASGRIELKKIEVELVAALSRASSLDAGLQDKGDALLRLVQAEGAVLWRDGVSLSLGTVPDHGLLPALVEWLGGQSGSCVVTDRLGECLPAAACMAGPASGILALTVSQLHPHYLIWFRPQVVQTVRWGGDPRKPGSDGEALNPRLSFEQWKEQVKGRSLPWSHAEIDAACDFRHALINLVLRHAEERAALTERLQRANAELESFSYSVSHDLRAPFRHIVGYTELLKNHDRALDDKSRHYLRSIADSALAAGQLVDDLLNFSHLGRTSLSSVAIDMNKLVEEVLRSLQIEYAQRPVQWRIERLAQAQGDPSLVRQVLANLVGNALKYSRGRDPAVITIASEERGGETVYTVSDNGIGFDMRYVHKLFGVFQRLHRMEDFEGTGIGLALVHRILERHGGWIRAEGEVGKGARFTFALPKNNGENDG